MVGASPPSFSQAQPLSDPAEVRKIYDRLLPQIEKIKIFDHHAHPGFSDDPDVDAMAAPPDATLPMRERDTNPELVEAAKALWDYPYDDFTPGHAKWLLDKKAALKKSLGDRYFSLLLDKLNIETSVANRAMMAPYLQKERFAWVFFADSFLWPFDNASERARNPDEEVFIPLQEKMLARWMQQESVEHLPDHFDAYLAFVTSVLKDNQKNGGIAMKFEVAYFRPTTFSDPTKQRAEEIYNHYAAGGVPSEAEYRVFQDFLFRYLVREGARLRIPVHIHTAVGIGDYFNFSQSNIMNLETVLRDPRYSKATFVMIHGGYPLEREAIWLASAKNVFLDSSYMEMAMYPEPFKRSLREWLETFPDKVTFGTDSFPYNEVLGAEESYWLGVRTGRTSLAAALAEMVAAREVTEPKALEIAHGYLHDNAAKLYGGKVR
jgi:hypothetical protein